MIANGIEDIIQILCQSFFDNFNDSWLTSENTVLVLAFDSLEPVIQLALFINDWNATCNLL